MSDTIHGEWRPVAWQETELGGEIVKHAALDGKTIAICEFVPDNRPRPDWSSAPDWATWWAVDSSGYAAWYDREPERETYQHHWKYGDRQSANAGMVEIPLGVDWRLLFESRPEES